MNPRAALLVLALVAVPTHGGGDLRTLGADLRTLYADDFDALFQKHGAAQGVDWRLLKAVAQVESHLNPRAVNRRDPSIGLMGVLCRPAGATSTTAPGVVLPPASMQSCGNRLDVAGWPPARREALFDPDFNVLIGAQVLAWNIERFGLRRGVACYNAWSICRDRQREPFSNQFYVDQVLARYHALQAEAAR